MNLLQKKKKKKERKKERKRKDEKKKRKKSLRGRSMRNKVKIVKYEKPKDNSSVKGES
jgi:hypothetical protein